MSGMVFPISTGKTAWKSKIGQEWTVEEERAGSGRRRTLINQAEPAITFDLNFPALTRQQRDQLTGFYARMRGSFDSFWYKDYSHHTAVGQGLPKGTDGKYQCLIVTGEYAEPAYKVENLKVYIDGVQTTDFTEQNGLITVAAGNKQVTADYDYYYKVAFSGALSVTELITGRYSVGIKLKRVIE